MMLSAQSNVPSSQRSQKETDKIVRRLPAPQLSASARRLPVPFVPSFLLVAPRHEVRLGPTLLAPVPRALLSWDLTALLCCVAQCGRTDFVVEEGADLGRQPQNGNVRTKHNTTHGRTEGDRSSNITRCNGEEWRAEWMAPLKLVSAC